MVPKHVIIALKVLIQDLIAQRYDKVEADGFAGSLDAAQLKSAIDNYGRELIQIPDSQLLSNEPIRIDDPEEIWAFDIDLWTKEEGSSDLTLSVWVKVVHEKVEIEITNLHVL